MRRSRLLIGLAVALVLGLILAEIVYKAMSQAQVQKTAVTTSQIVVAAEQLPLGTRLEGNDLKLISWPSDQPIQGVFTRVQDCVGRALITPVLPGEPILEGKLAPKDAGAGLPAVIPEGMRAVSVAVNDVVAVAGFAQPGTSVDVMVTGQSQGGNNEQVTRTILEDVRVLAANQRTEQDRQGQAQTVTVITLLVTPEDADKLAMANTMGRVQLALRNAIDENKTAPPPLYQASLLGAPPPAAPAPTATHAKAKPAAPAAPPAYSVEVIRASKREVSEFPNQ